MVELKNGESFNGHLIDCDAFMNVTLREVYQTAADSDRFWKIKEVYIRGSTVSRLFRSLEVLGQSISMQIKYLQVQPALLDSVKEDQQRAREANRGGSGGQRGVFYFVSIAQNAVDMPTQVDEEGDVVVDQVSIYVPLWTRQNVLMITCDSSRWSCDGKGQSRSRTRLMP